MKGIPVSILALICSIFSFSHAFNTRSRLITGHQSSIKSSRSSTSIPTLQDGTLPRLNKDIGAIFSFVETNGGTSAVDIKEHKEGWTIHTKQDAAKDQTLLRIPKKVCVFSEVQHMHVPVIENADRLIASIDPSQWRLRLAIALLSERVRPKSFYSAYISNLPFEFWGIPLFFSSAEFSTMQDISLMHKTRERCRVLTDFLTNVVAPLQKSSLDPFLGMSSDVNSLGWAFACAASRALRLPTGGAVMVPVVDMASHSSTPSCRVVDEDNAFVLVTNQHLKQGAEITIDYGPLSNEELFVDFGFTIDGNQFDKFVVNCDATLIDTARVVMGLSNAFGDHLSAGSVAPERLRPIGIGSDKFEDRKLAVWQIDWMKALGFYGPGADTSVVIRGDDVNGIDPRLWAYLRILYAQSEADITSHGYDPFTLQSRSSYLSLEIEVNVLKTVVGILAVVLRSFGSDLLHDLYSLKNDMHDAAAEMRGAPAASGGNLLEDITRVMRRALQLPDVPSASPTVRRIQEMLASAQPAKKPPVKIYENNSPFTSVNTTLEKSLEDIIRSQFYGPSLESDKVAREALESIGVVDDNKASTSTVIEGRGVAEIVYTENLDQYGAGLSVNVRESLKYRIRKKQRISDLIYRVGEMHKRVQQARGEPDDLLPTFVTATDRRMKLKELMDEARSKGVTKDAELLEKSSLLSSSWAQKGLEL